MWFAEDRDKLISQLIAFEKEIQNQNAYINKKAGERLKLEETLKRISLDLAQITAENQVLKKQISNLSSDQCEFSQLQSENTILRNKVIVLESLQRTSSKECPACKRTQPLSEFNKNSNQSDGLTKWCIKCLVDGAPMPNDTSGTKVCEKCGQNRRKTSFYPSSKYSDGLSKWCKFCLDKH